MQKEQDIKLALKKRPGQKHEDDFKSLQAKIQNIEAQIISEHAMYSSVEDMKKKIEDLNGLKKELEDLQAMYDGVVRDRRDKYEKGSVEELSFRNSLENLVFMFGDTKNILDQKIGKLEKGVELVTSLTARVSSVRGWAARAQEFVSDHSSVPVGDTEKLEALLDQSNKLEEEKADIKTKLTEIETIKSEILEDCAEEFSRSVKEDTGELQSKFDAVSEPAFQLNEGLRRGLEKTEAVYRMMDEIEEFLSSIEAAMPSAAECDIADSSQLYHMKCRFQALKDRCDQTTELFREANEQGNDMLLSASPPPPQLARRLTQLNAGWTRVTPLVYERYKILAEAWLESGELRSWLTREAAWLQGLGRLLARPPRAADAEEYTTLLTDLESYLAKRSSGQWERIEDVARQLIAAQIMPAALQADTRRLRAAWAQLQPQVSERLALLEAAAAEAHAAESKLDEVRRWLQAPPTDEAVLASELAAHRQTLTELEALATAHRAAGRTEAAEHLATQAHSLTRALSALDTSSPAPLTPACIAPRLQAAWDSLARVQAALPQLALTGARPDPVRDTLRDCLRFYRTLSEIKSEVEGIIKSGRKMVEEKSVPEPQEFSKKIDSLKELYNKLGAQITESKTKLESALITAREIQNDLQSLTSWLDGLDANMGKQTLELEMSRMQAIRDKLNANHVEFSRHCDAAHLADLREQIDAVNRRWDHLKKHGVSKPLDLTSVQKYLADVDAQLDGEVTPEKLRDMERELRAQAKDIEALDNKAVHKQWENILTKIATARPAYAEVTDTVRRRVESPVDRNNDYKKSKIPLAVRSPAPIRRELTRGQRSRTPSLERAPAPPSPASTRSVDSLTPAPVDKDSSTFNLLQDSELFTQINNNKIEPKPPLPPANKPSSLHVVAVKEHEIVKSTVNENRDEYKTETVETVMQFIPQTVETVDIVDDDSDDETKQKRPSVDLGNEPKTFVVQVTTLEQRMKPQLGILKRKHSSPDEKQKVMKVTIDSVPDIIPSAEIHDESMKTPPPTPAGEEDQDNPLDMAEKQKEAHQNLRMDEVNEYRILDEVPKDQAALPEPSATEAASDANVNTTPADKTKHKDEEILDSADVKTDEEAKVDDDAEISRKKSNGVGEEEVIYTEVQESSEGRESPQGAPLSTSTPLKHSAQVVAVSPKIGARENKEEQDKSKSEDSKPRKSPPSPLPKLALPAAPAAPATPATPASPATPTTPGSPGGNSTPGRERLTSVDKYQKTEDFDELSPLPDSPGTPSLLSEAFQSSCSVELAAWEAAAAALARRMGVVALTVRGVASERDPAKRLEILKHQLGGLAADAAALISRGDSLVYEQHRTDPLLAAAIQTTYQDKLRNKWSAVVAEIESLRAVALRAEDQLKELQQLSASLQPLPDATDDQAWLQYSSRMERLAEICRWLKAERVGYPERAIADLTTRWSQAKRDYELQRSKEGKVSAYYPLLPGEVAIYNTSCSRALRFALKSFPVGILG
ncbi:dystrophin, isoforms A/C/F/G/H-like isoform X2 [Plutella xylostella]|uniref:dystrophin, isoforms A/C/F/G/H-like isoform X2 n=1 Tax=Plutella xylostella TaxID=51655 RepID=UPI002032D5D7|nr:dystrophin, isoforms A/C/F/G/H-like isoform X2 [Plutella xylostella]